MATSLPKRLCRMPPESPTPLPYISLDVWLWEIRPFLEERQDQLALVLAFRATANTVGWAGPSLYFAPAFPRSQGARITRMDVFEARCRHGLFREDPWYPVGFGSPKCREVAFKWACTIGAFEVVAKLLFGTHPFNPSANKEAAFVAACANGHDNIVGLLLHHHDDVNVRADGCAAFLGACAGGHTPVVERLLDLTGDRVIVGLDRGLRRAAMNGHLDVVRFIVRIIGSRRLRRRQLHDDGFLPACQNGHLAVVNYLLSIAGARRINPNTDGANAFRWACRGGHAHVVRRLLALTGVRRVDVYAHNYDAFKKAYTYGHKEVLDVFLGLTNHRRLPDGLRKLCDGSVSARHARAWLHSHKMRGWTI